MQKRSGSTKPSRKAVVRSAPRVTPQAGPGPDDVEVITLPNGLTLILREDHSAPVVSAQAWCRTGSIHEGKWLGAGLSHVLEHMLFKGTKTRPGHRIDQEVQEAGGYMNAYTSFDRTVYWINAPSSGTRPVVDILCDIMQNAALPADELAKELDVIRREMDMNQDDPGRRAGRRLFETAYTASPYRYTVIGYPDIFNDLKPEDIRGYYEERYVPNNVFFVVVGDFEAQAVRDQIAEAYSKSKARALPPVFLPDEPRQTAARQVVEEAPIELGHMHIGYHIPDVRHPDVPLLDVLASLMGSGRSSRLYRKVREQLGVVHHVDAWTYNPGAIGLFGMSAVMDGKRFEEAASALRDEVSLVQRKGVTKAELSKAVKQFVAGTLSSRKTMQGQAQDLGGNWLAAGDLGFSQRVLDMVKAASPADIQRVARQHLVESNRTTYALLPEGSAQKRVFSIGQASRSEIQKLSLPHGLRLLVKEDHRLPFVEFRAVFQGGVLSETVADSGITQLTARTIIKGTRGRSAEQIAEEVESVGGSIDSYGGNNSFGVNLEVMSSDLGLGVDMLADVLLNPTFPADVIAREVEVQLAGIRSHRDDPLKCASKAMREGLFGQAGYGLDPSGSEASVQRLTRKDLARYHSTHCTPGNAVLAVFGDVKAVEIERRLRTALKSWTRGGSPSLPRESAFPDTLVRRSTHLDKKQAVLVLGFPGTTIHSADRHVLDLIQEACSDLGSRLFMRIREKLGLAYYVGAQHMAGIAPGYFGFYVGTDPAKEALVEEELLKEAALLRAEGLSQEELDRARTKILGNHKIARQDLGHLAMSCALDELYGLGYDHHQEEERRLGKVTVEDTRVVATKYLKADRLVIAKALPAP